MLLPALAWLVLALAAFAEDWPRFRGPNGAGVSESVNLPAEFGPAKNLLWKTDVPFSRSSPVIAGARIFLTAVNGGKLLTFAIARDTGKILWRREIARPRVSRHYKFNDAATPTPVADAKNVYAFFPDLGLVSYTAEGKERWRLPLGPFDVFYGLAASPTLSRGTLYLVCDGRTNAFIAAVDAESGRLKWKTERKEIQFEGWASPVVWSPKEGGPEQVIALGPNRLDAYSASTGERVWRMPGLAFMPVSSPVIANGRVLVSTYGADKPQGPSWEQFLKSDQNGDGRLQPDEMKDFDEFGAVDRNKDGFLEKEEYAQLRDASVGEYGMVAVRLGATGDLTGKGIEWRNRKNYDSMPTPVLYRDVLYVVKSGGIIASLNPETGDAYLVDRSKEALGTYWSSPVAADRKVYFINDACKVTVIEAGKQWKILAVNDLADECYATPAIANGSIFVRTKQALYAFGKK